MPVARMAPFHRRELGLGICGAHGGKAVETDGIDASISVLGLNGQKEIAMDPATKSRIDALWKKLGLEDY
jgi:hypothetical protein